MRPPISLRRAASAALFSVLLSSTVSCAPAADELDELELASQDQALPIRGDGDGDGDGPTRPRRPTNPPPTPRPSLVELMSSFTNYDLNTDGRVEIHSLKPAQVNPPPYATAPKGVVIVFVDPRLVRDEPGTTISASTMRGWLASYGWDLTEDGYFPYFVEADVYHGTQHQDGRTLLAMRRFLKRVNDHYPLAGTVLVGSFPEAAIVRTTLTRNYHYNVTFTSNSILHRNAHTLEVFSELVTPCGDIVLGDLDGNWENLYREKEFTYRGASLRPTTTAFPFAGQVLESADFTPQVETWADVFFLDDAQVTVTKVQDAVEIGAEQALGSRVRVAIHSIEEKNPEIGPYDDLNPNRMARPEIMVSRINPLHVATMPMADAPDLDGKTSPIGSDGKPQTLHYGPHDGQRPWPQVTWVRSPHLERKLLVEYFARQHDFRRGGDNDKPFRTSAIRQLPDPGTEALRRPDDFSAMLRRAASGFGTSLTYDNARILDYIDWLKQPAVLRGIASHSTSVSSQFGPSDDLGAIESAIGGKMWQWQGPRNWATGMDWVLSPNLHHGDVDAIFEIYRTMWENGMLADAGQSFVLHEGCHVNAARNARHVPYNHPTYGDGGQNGESMLFYANVLALMGRNKDFNDSPRNFADAIKATGEFGRGWADYFYHDAAESALDERSKPYGVERRTATLQRKRAYFWNLLGDWTLKLRYP
jgi:hypothetical protein